jgi:DNA-binding SARP family transcriptional activator
MDFAVLGSLRARAHGQDLAVGGPRRRALLLRLLADPAQVIPSDVLTEDLWDGVPPAAAPATLQSHISSLRKVVGADRLRSEGRGYLLAVGPEELDASRFTGDTTAGLAALAAGDAATAEARLVAALALWRGRPFADVEGAPWVLPYVGRLVERHGAALEGLVEARLALGDTVGAVAVADEGVREHPLREHLWALLMRALWAAGRQAESLRACGRVRAILAEQLGIDPGPEITELEVRILRGEVEPPAPAPAGRTAVLPDGVVTFLLTDVVGSTALWETAPDAMEAALREHDALIATAVAAHGGHLVTARGEGDATFSAFARASDALAAALAAHLALRDRTWSTPTPLRVRMALHAGEASPRDGDYRGPSANRAARLRGLARGGQILLSGRTAELVMDRLPEGTKLVELGAYSLRDIGRAETVYALDAPGLEVALVGVPEAGGEAGLAIPIPGRLAAAASTHLVGRAEPLARIGAQLDTTIAGGHGLVLVEGEPGIGKTALVALAGMEAHSEGSTVLYGRCDEGITVPFGPFGEALAHYVEQAPQGILARHVAEHGGVLARVVPALRTRVRAVASLPELDGATERALLPQAIAALLRAASEGHSLVVVLDDLHWADPDTLLLLRHLAGRALPHVLVLGTFRTVDPTVTGPLADALVAFAREPGVERIALSGLDDRAIAELLEASTGTPLDASARDLAARLLADTDGNPFFLSELLHHLVETGALGLDGDGRWTWTADEVGLPHGVRETIARRVARLGPDAARVLAAGAVLGAEFDLATAAVVASAERAGARDGIERAIRAGLVREIPAADDRFGFAHALVRQVLNDDLPPATARDLHRKAAAALTARAESIATPRAAIAHHALMAATEPAEVVEAAALAGDAGEDALADLAPTDAILWFERAQAALLAVPGDHAAALNRLEVGLGDAQQQAGDARHRETLLGAAQHAIALGATDVLVRAALANSRGWESQVGVLDEGRVAMLRAALDAIGPSDSAERARLLALLATELQAGADWDAVVAAQDESIAIARRVGDPVTLLAALRAGSNGWVPSTLAARLDRSAEAVVLAESLGDLRAVFDAAILRVAASFQAGDREAGDRYLDQARVTADRLGLPVARWTACGFGAWRTLLAGRVSEAEQLANESFALGSDAGQPDAFAFFGALVLGIRTHEGRLGEFVEMLEGLAAANPNVAGFRATLGYSLVEADRVDDARRLLDRDAEAGFASVPYDSMWLPALVLWSTVAGMIGAASAGESLRAALMPWRAQVALTGTGVLGSVEHALGMASLGAGALDAADAHFAAAARVHTRLDAPFLLANTRLWWGRALRQRLGPDDRARSATLLREAYVVATELGYQAVARRAADELTE